MTTTPSSPASSGPQTARASTLHLVRLAVAVAIGCALLRYVVFDDTIAEGLGIGVASGIGFLLGLLAFESWRGRPTGG